MAQQPDLHCNIDEGTFSLAMFLSRLICGVTLIYITLGCLFFWRDFIYNLASLRVPFSVSVGFGLIVAELFLSLFLILGWHTRACAVTLCASTLLCALVFFGGELNKIFVVLCFLLVAAMLPVALLGPGRISLDFKRSVRRSRRFFRG